MSDKVGLFGYQTTLAHLVPQDLSAGIDEYPRIRRDHFSGEAFQERSQDHIPSLINAILRTPL